MLDRLPEFVGNHPLLSLAFVGILVVLVATEIARRLRPFKEITPAELTRLINAEDAALVDVSAYNDFEKGHIPNAVHVPMSQVAPDNKTLARLKDRPVTLYCKTGHVSEQACKRLAKGGFPRVYWLSGGLQAWLNDQLPVARGRK